MQLFNLFTVTMFLPALIAALPVDDQTVFNCETCDTYHPCKIASDIGLCITREFPLNLLDSGCGECSENWIKYTKACVDSGCGTWKGNPLEKCLWKRAPGTWR